MLDDMAKAIADLISATRGRAQASIECEPQVLQCGTLAAGNQFDGVSGVRTTVSIRASMAADCYCDSPSVVQELWRRVHSGEARCLIRASRNSINQFSPPIHTVAPSSRNPIAVGAALPGSVFLAASGLGI